MIEIQKYSPDLEQNWEIFCKDVNAHFQFTRKFLNYHLPETFEDFSVLLKIKGKIEGVFPAAKIKNSIVSHPGLGFGGLVTRENVLPGDFENLFKKTINHFREMEIQEIKIKSKPIHYNKGFDAIEEYFLRDNNFQIDEYELNSIIYLENAPKYSERKRRNIKKFHGSINLEHPKALPEFYKCLSQVLEARYNVKPTHTLENLIYLFDSFSENISLVSARINDMIVAGAVIFKFGRTWNTQYLASNSIGREFGALDAVIDSIITEAKAQSIKMLILGRSTDKTGTLNESLLKYKLEFGAIPIVRNTYKSTFK